MGDLKICALASGSNGNCYYVGNTHGALLIDAGVSCRELIKRAEILGINLHEIDGILVTHEHTDHIRGVEQLVKRFGIPVFITRSTLAHAHLLLDKRSVHFIDLDMKLTIGVFEVDIFSKIHDAADPASFMISYAGKNVSVLTDIGKPCANVIQRLAKSDAVFLEANYDEHMLLQGAYPDHLKKRISGGLGHISNYEAGLLVLEHATPRLKHVFLSHLSENNNDPEIAYTTFTTLLSQRKDLAIQAIMTSRHAATEIYTL